MILLDENIPDDQRQLLRKWRLRPRQIGQDVGRQGMKDKEQIVPFLHKLDHPTFFTLDMGFFAKDFCHDGYCLICLDVSQKEAALFAKRFLRHRGTRPIELSERGRQAVGPACTRHAIA